MDEELENLYRWVDEIPLSRSKKNISRDFSDGVLMAEILKYFYPRLVDIHNYPPTNSLARKITNWATLNKKVLSKIGLLLSKADIERLAGASEGAIENVLLSLYNKLKAEREKLLQQQEQQKNLQQNVFIVQKKDQALPVSGIPIKTDQKSGSRVILVTEKMVPMSEIEKISLELAEKDKTIKALSSKVLHFEQLLKLKDQRINDLLQQLHIATQDKSALSSDDEDYSTANSNKLNSCIKNLINR